MTMMKMTMITMLLVIVLGDDDSDEDDNDYNALGRALSATNRDLEKKQRTIFQAFPCGEGRDYHVDDGEEDGDT